MGDSFLEEQEKRRLRYANSGEDTFDDVVEYNDPNFPPSGNPEQDNFDDVVEYNTQDYATDPYADGRVRPDGTSFALNLGRNMLQDGISTTAATQAARLGSWGLTAINPAAGTLAKVASYAVPAIAASGFAEWLTGQFVRPEESTNYDVGANAVSGALTAKLMPPGARTAINSMAGLVADKGSDVASDALKRSAVIDRFKGLGATVPESGLEAISLAERQARGLAKDAPAVLVNRSEAALKRLQDGGFWKRTKSSPTGALQGLEDNLLKTTNELDAELAKIAPGAVNFPSLTEIKDPLVKYINETFLLKEREAALRELDNVLLDYAAAVNTGDISVMNSFKRKLYTRTNYSSEAAVDPTINSLRMAAGDSIKQVVSDGYAQAKGLVPGTASIVDDLNKIDSDLLIVRPLFERYSRLKDNSTLQNAMQGLGDTELGRKLSLATMMGGGIAGGVSPLLSVPATLAAGLYNSQVGKMYRAGGKEFLADGIKSAAPIAGKVGAAAIEALPSVAVKNLIEGTTGSADAQGMPPQESASMAIPDSVKQMLAQQQGQGQVQGPSFLPEVPFANGLPRSTDGWNAQTLQVFLQRRMEGGPDPVAQGMAQKLEGAIHAQDESKAERIIADMAKLYPALFEPGLGVNNKIFHPDDQDEYLRLLKSSARNGRVDAIFLAKQRESFLDPNDSQILPIQEGLVGKIDSQLSQMSRRAPKKGAEAREYAY